MVKLHVTIKTPSRIHLGILDLNGSLGRLYGSIGIGLDYPNVIIEATRSKKIEIMGKNRVLVKNLAERFLDYYNIQSGVKINVNETIPEHVGLGSGTQLALAIGTAISKIYKINVTTREISQILYRGKISGIGTAIFDHGGFVVDTGHRIKNDSVPKIMFRHPLSDNWYFIVVIPKISRGLSGKKEYDIIKKLIPSPERTVSKICRLVLMQMLPSLIEKDIVEFGKSLSNVDKLVGTYFMKVQSGLYKDKILESIISSLIKNGAYGAGQSSWGPAVYGLTTKNESEKLKYSLEYFLKKNKINADVFVSKPRNRGAEVIII